MLYTQLGLEHILDKSGYDHILFVIAICAVYSLKDWKKVAWLVTAFTIGHSLTLALATLKIVVIPSEIVEFLIPITILLTCFVNFGVHPEKTSPINYQRYLLAAFFGLIHGLGFSNFLRSMVGREPDILLPLLQFNIGLEIGQLVIVTLTLLLGYFFTKILKIKQRDWILVVSGMVAGVALTIVQKNWIF